MTAIDGQSLVVRASDGVELDIVVAGQPENPGILITPPIGMPSQVLAGLVNYLAADFRVVIWETRGCPGRGGFDARHFGVHDHARDLHSIVEFLEFDSLALAGWSSGALIALAAAHRWPEIVRQVILLQPGVPHSMMVKKTEDSESLSLLCETLWQNEAAAAQLSQIFFNNSIWEGERDEARKFAISCSRQVLQKDPDALRRMGLLIWQLLDDDSMEEWLKNVPVHCDMLLVDGDTAAPLENSFALSNLIKVMSEVKIVKGTHYSVCREHHIHVEVRRLAKIRVA